MTGGSYNLMDFPPKFAEARRRAFRCWLAAGGMVGGSLLAVVMLVLDAGSVDPVRLIAPAVAAVLGLGLAVGAAIARPSYPPQSDVQVGP